MTNIGLGRIWVFVCGGVLATAFLVANADYHQAKCVPALKMWQVISNTCAFNKQGQCVGGATVHEIVVNGYCDPTETGDCFDAIIAYTVCTEDISVECRKRGGICDMGHVVSSGPKSPIQVPTCSPN